MYNSNFISLKSYFKNFKKSIFITPTSPSYIYAGILFYPY